MKTVKRGNCEKHISDGASWHFGPRFLFPSTQGKFLCCSFQHKNPSVATIFGLFLKWTPCSSELQLVYWWLYDTVKWPGSFRFHVFIHFPLLCCYLRWGGFVLTHFCLFVGLSAGLHKNYWTDFHETGMEDGSRPRIDPFYFWCGSGKRDESRIFFLTVFNNVTDGIF